MTPPMEEVTAQGYDLQFGTNVLGLYHFASDLNSVLISSRPFLFDEAALARFIIDHKSIPRWQGTRGQHVFLYTSLHRFRLRDL